MKPKHSSLEMSDLVGYSPQSNEEWTSEDKEGSDEILRCNMDEVDPDRVVYDLYELKRMPKELFYCRRKYIRFGYISNPNMTLGKCTSTLLMCHCESGNIWTHLIPGLYFIAHLVMASFPKSFDLYSDFKDQQTLNLLRIGCFSIIFCLIASSMYHLYNAVS